MKYQANWSEAYSQTVKSRLSNHVYPSIGDIPVSQLTKIDISNVITSINNKKTIVTANKVASIVYNILESACDKGLIEAVPMGRVKNLTPKHTSKPMRTILNKERIGELLKEIDQYKGMPTTLYALKLLPYLAVRSTEFRSAYWAEVDLEKKVWTIPAKHRKLPKDKKNNPANSHTVPLSNQVVTLLNELKVHTGNAERLFPCCGKDKTKPMSENTINKALKKMGFAEEIVGHGFRAMFSSIMNTRGFNPDAIERQLAHVDKNTVRRVYNRADYLEERVKIMHDWSNCIDNMRNNGSLPA